MTSYFCDSIIAPQDNVTLIDVGAYDGDSIEQVRQFYGEKLKSCVAFEPDDVSCAKLTEYVDKSGISETCKIYPYALGNTDKTIGFSHSGVTSEISEGGILNAGQYRTDIRTKTDIIWEESMRGLALDYRSEDLIKPVERLYGITEGERYVIECALPNAWTRCMNCFAHVNNPRFHTGGVYTLHTVQYSMFVYFLMNEIYNDTSSVCEEDKTAVLDKLFSVNTALAGVDIFYEQKLPDIFLMAHTAGIVMTPYAKIGNYFLFMQGCNVGYSSANGHAPVIGEGVIMYGNSKIIGNCHIGDHVMFGANTYIKDMDIPSNSLVFGQYPNIIIKENREDQVMESLRSRFIM